MDGKGSRRLSSANDRPRRRRNVVDFRKKCKEFLVKNRQSFLAGILITGIVILLFGVLAGFKHLLSTLPQLVRTLLITAPSKSK